ncbi:MULTISPECIES: hypothetical protein [Pseudomonadaceae]|jgi:hypothetical protein|uniref:Uncharacterized protein n=1 Tax=Ectopseudomonas oleovorans TaxID=301 RepID=A0A653B945_ECTOL|nr:MULTISPECIES: hypothetical protein [Pseudomonas]AZM85460.1 hypothetical protein EIP87_26605 [Pseudomonas aeruginosa]EIU1412101.1 hypothetical protein [Pseudomonas aeruginosa]EJB8511175.1 hypothetical protein [Pseudomonas aeruginosa]EKL8565485.1 hypothetical protein [Pseudomonas aeruginosa]EKN9352638.1 hypothetical protein [Pseudomonas aeruginosa]
MSDVEIWFAQNLFFVKVPKSNVFFNRPKPTSQKPTFPTESAEEVLRKQLYPCQTKSLTAAYEGALHYDFD